jgi:hypothetical protein
VVIRGSKFKQENKDLKADHVTVHTYSIRKKGISVPQEKWLLLQRDQPEPISLHEANHPVQFLVRNNGMYKVYYSEHNPTITHYGTKKWNQKQVHPRVTDSQTSPVTQVEATLVARPLLTPTTQNCAAVSMVYSRAQRMFMHMFVQHLATRILIRKYRIGQQFTGW